MNNNFKDILEQYSDEWETVVKSTTLDQLAENFSRCAKLRASIFDWVFEKIEDGPEQGEYLSIFNDVESNLIEQVGDVPIFDTSLDINDSFNDYEGYYQRYGCMTPEDVVSWDKSSFLWVDDEGVTSIVIRPDVLMGVDQ